MSITIRLSKIGKKNAPSYKVVVSNTRDKRDGDFLDILGYFDPHKKLDNFSIDKKKYEEWTKNGALTSDAVAKLIKGEYKFVKYSPKQVKKTAEAEKPKATLEE